MPPWDDNDEASFVQRLRARDERAFNVLVRTYEGRVFGLILRMIGNRAEAEDLAQEVFVQVFKAIDQFRGDSKLSTWVYRITVNICKNRYKYLQRRHTNQQQELEPLAERVPMSNARGTTVGEVARPDELLVGRQVERAVQNAILQLEPDFREALVLRDVEDLNYEEIAQITGVPEGTVKSRIHRARAQLRALVEQTLGEKVE